MAHIVGTQFFDVLNGTAGDDLIEGLGGIDQLNGGGGNDTLLGGEGNDRLDGGSGNDRVEGGEGNDSITDNDGGDDLLFGGEGDDFIYLRRESYRGNVEKVEIYGGVGWDRVTYYNASAASALIDTGDGNDTVILERSSAGTVITLGAGRDTLDLNQYQFVTAHQLTLTDFQAGDGGDWISFLAPIGHYLQNWNQSLNPFGTGHLSFRQDGADAVLRVDLDGAGGMLAYDAILFKNIQASALTLENLDGYTVDGSTPVSVQQTGTDAMEHFNGNGGHDLLQGGGGDDSLSGRGGDDVLHGGLGNDYLFGGAGNDTLEGGDGDDNLSDTSGGSDVMDGGEGNDSFYLYRLNHSLNEHVTMRGGNGDDQFTAWSYASGTVTMDGGAGADNFTLWTSDNSQTITLGDGVDTIDLDRFQASDILTTNRVVTDFDTGATGDIVLLQSFLTSWTSWNGASNPFDTGHLKLVQRGGDAVLQATGVRGINGGQAGDGDLLIFQNRTTASFAAENFGGLSPNGVPPAGKTIIGTDEADILTGSFGNDVIEGRGGDDTLKGSAGNDILRGGEGGDTIHGGDGDDLMDGGAGDDWLEANHERGSDTMIGGDGADFIFVYRNAEGSVENVTIDAGVGDDRVIYQNFDQGSVAIDLGTGADELTLRGARGTTRVVLGAGKDEVDFDNHYVSLLGDFTITITDYLPGEDRLTWGSYFARELVGWNQQANPFATGHLLVTQNGAHVELRIDRDGAGGTYATQAFLTLENVALGALTRADFGGLPPDGGDVDRILTGTQAADTLTGGTGNDTLDGRLGDDTLDGGAGADLLIGGAGDDTFIVDDAGDKSNENAGEGMDEIRASVTYVLPDNVERLVLTGATAIDGTGNTAANWIQGNAAANLLDGGGGDDLLYGGGGADRLVGGPGNDVLDGGLGADRLEGGVGDDVYIFDGTGDVTVERDGEGVDQVRSMAGLVALAENVEQLVHVGSGQVIGYGNSVGNSMAAGAKADFLSAFAGNDLINGWAGDDIIHGGAGDDTIIGGTGADTLYGGDGADTLVLAGSIKDYTVAKSSDAWLVTGGFTDTVSGFEIVLVGGQTIAWDAFVSEAFDALRYIASHPDLIRAYGANADAGKQHYAWAGQSEGRSLTAFDPLIYAASHPDVFAAFGQDRQALTRHYIENGFAEGRSTASFDPVIYAASHLDVARAFGYDREALTQHFLEEGLRQGRDPDSFDPLRYGASNPDVAQAFGTDVAALSRHWIDYGSYEGRSATSFDPREYAAVNTDVARAFGTDLKAITLHYIQDGITQGRATSGFDEVGYLLSYSDLGDAGLGASGAFSHWLSDGIYQNRFGDAEFGREQDSHSLLVNGATSAAFETAGDHDWFQFSASAGQQVSIDLRGVAGTLDLHRSDGSLVATSNTGSLDVAVSAADNYYLSTSGALPAMYVIEAFVV